MAVVRGQGVREGRCRWSSAVRERRARVGRARGFTILELLIVLAIVVVLIGITLPVYLVAREQQRRLACSAYLQQAYTALRQYQDDEEGFPPAYRPGGGGGIDHGALATLLQPGYGQLRDALRCPNDRVRAAAVGSGYSTYSEYYNYWGWDKEGLPYTDPNDPAPKKIDVPPGNPAYRNPAPRWGEEGPWPNGVPVSKEWDFFPKLGDEYPYYDPGTGEFVEWRRNRDHVPPPGTMVTRCVHHHSRLTDAELLLHLDGHYDRIKHSDWAQPDGTGDPFVYQPTDLGKP